MEPASCEPLLPEAVADTPPPDGVEGKRERAVEMLETYHELITSVYAKYNPEKVSEVDRLVGKFREQLDKVDDYDLFREKSGEKLKGLYQAICKKYGADAKPLAAAGEGHEEPPQLPPATETSASVADPVEVYRAAILELYREHNPDKVSGVDALMDKYRGGEADLYKRICQKYGVTPKPDLLPQEEKKEEEQADEGPAVTASLGAWGTGLWSRGLTTLQTLNSAAENLRSTAEGLREQVERSFEEALRSEEDVSVLQVVQGLHAGAKGGSAEVAGNHEAAEVRDNEPEPASALAATALGHDDDDGEGRPAGWGEETEGGAGDAGEAALQQHGGEEAGGPAAPADAASVAGSHDPGGADGDAEGPQEQAIALQEEPAAQEPGGGGGGPGPGPRRPEEDAVEAQTPAAPTDGWDDEGWPVTPPATAPDGPEQGGEAADLPVVEASEVPREAEASEAEAEVASPRAAEEPPQEADSAAPEEPQKVEDPDQQNADVHEPAPPPTAQPTSAAIAEAPPAPTTAPSPEPTTPAKAPAASPPVAPAPAVAAAAAPLAAWGGGLLSSGLRTLQTLQGAAEGLREQVEKTFDEAIRSEEEVSTLQVVQGLRGAAEKGAERAAAAAPPVAAPPAAAPVEAVAAASPTPPPRGKPREDAAAAGAPREPAVDAPAAAPVLAQDAVPSAAVQQRHLQEVRHLQEQLEASQGVRERLARELQGVRAKHAHLIEEGKNMSKRVLAVEERMKGAVAEARRAEAQAAELERQREALQGQVARLATRAEKAEAAHAEQRGEARRLGAELDKVRKQLQDEKQQLATDIFAQQQRSKEQGLRERQIEERLLATVRERDELLATNATLTMDLQRALSAADAAERRLQQQALDAEQAAELQQRRIEAVELEFANQSLPFQRQIADLEGQLREQERRMGEREAAMRREREAMRVEVEAAQEEMRRREEQQARREQEVRDDALRAQRAAAEAAEAARQVGEVQRACEAAERAKEAAEAELRLEAARKRSAEQRAAELADRAAELGRRVSQLEAAAAAAAALPPPGAPAPTPMLAPAVAADVAAAPPAGGFEAEARRLRMQLDSLTRQRDALERENSRLQQNVDALQQRAGGAVPLEQRFEAALQAIGRLQEELELVQEQREAYKQQCHQLSQLLGRSPATTTSPAAA